MMASASSEFIALCQSQLALLTQTLGATSTVIYLAESSPDQVSPTLVPLAAYPHSPEQEEGFGTMLSDAVLTLPEFEDNTSNLLIAGQSGLDDEPASAPTAYQPSRQPREASATDCQEPRGNIGSDSSGNKPPKAQQMVLPLAHEGVMLGVMVSTRQTPPWDRQEYQQAEHVANSLALACVMDQRGQWLQQQLRQRQLTQEIQSETFHDLLHQFRNPLTALQTFGKLLLKRLRTDDPNQSIVQSIVRESQRLQDLAENFDQAVSRADADLESTPADVPSSFLLPAASSPEDTDSTESFAQNLLSQEAVDHSGSSATSNSHPLGRDLVMAPGQITDVIEPVLQSTVAITQEKGMVLHHDIPTDLPPVWMDAGALREVLSNLLDNAIKYAPAGALIWVTGGLVQSWEGKLFQGIAVGDTGAGIPTGDQQQIFQRHYRGIQSAGNIPGTGLGLAIVQELLQGMGGHIDLISPVQFDHWLPADAPVTVRGPGTLFIVWLPTV
jgi:signal transduction histidine kinase